MRDTNEATEAPAGAPDRRTAGGPSAAGVSKLLFGRGPTLYDEKEAA